MLPEGIFIVKFNTRPQKFKTFVTRCCLMVPDTIFIVKHPTSKRYENYIQVSITSGSCQIVDIDVLLGRSIQHLCNEVLFHGSARMKTLYAKSPNLLVIPEKNLVNHVGDSSATK